MTFQVACNCKLISTLKRHVVKKPWLSIFTLPAQQAAMTILTALSVAEIRYVFVLFGHSSIGVLVSYETCERTWVSGVHLKISESDQVWSPCAATPKC